MDVDLPSTSLPKRIGSTSAAAGWLAELARTKYGNNFRGGPEDVIKVAIRVDKTGLSTIKKIVNAPLLLLRSSHILAVIFTLLFDSQLSH